MKMNIACEDVNIFGQPTVVDSGQNNPYELLKKAIANIRQFNRHRKWMEYEAWVKIL